MSNVHIGYHRYHEGRFHHPNAHYITTIPNTQHTGHFHGTHRGTVRNHHHDTHSHHHHPHHIHDGHYHGNAVQVHHHHDNNQQGRRVHHHHEHFQPLFGHHPSVHGNTPHVHDNYHCYHCNTPTTHVRHVRDNREPIKTPETCSLCCGESCAFNTCCCHNERECGYNYERAYYCDNAGGHDCGLVLAVDKVPPLAKPKLPKKKVWREEPIDSPRTELVPNEPRFRWDKHLGRTTKMEQSYREVITDKPRPPVERKHERRELEGIIKTRSSERARNSGRLSRRENQRPKLIEKDSQTEESPRIWDKENEKRERSGGKINKIYHPHPPKSSEFLYSSKSSHRKSKTAYPGKTSPYNNNFRPKSPYKCSVGVYDIDVSGSNISRHMELDHITRSTVSSRAKQKPSIFVASYFENLQASREQESAEESTLDNWREGKQKKTRRYLHGSFEEVSQVTLTSGEEDLDPRLLVERRSTKKSRKYSAREKRSHSESDDSFEKVSQASFSSSDFDRGKARKAGKQSRDSDVRPSSAREKHYAVAGANEIEREVTRESRYSRFDARESIVHSKREMEFREESPKRTPSKRGHQLLVESGEGMGGEDAEEGDMLVMGGGLVADPPRRDRSWSANKHSRVGHRDSDSESEIEMHGKGKDHKRISADRFDLKAESKGVDLEDEIKSEIEMGGKDKDHKHISADRFAPNAGRKEEDRESEIESEIVMGGNEKSHRRISADRFIPKAVRREEDRESETESEIVMGGNDKGHRRISAGGSVLDPERKDDFRSSNKVAVIRAREETEATQPYSEDYESDESGRRELEKMYQEQLSSSTSDIAGYSRPKTSMGKR